MFVTESKGRTMGLGSGMADYSKDCGYQVRYLRLKAPLLLFECLMLPCFQMVGHGGAGVSPLMDGSVLAFGGCVRNRLINNALIFAAQCWGHIALRDTPGGLEPYNSTYTYTKEEFGVKIPGDKARQVAAYGYARAKTFFGSLFTEGSIKSANREPLLVSTTLALGACILTARCLPVCGRYGPSRWNAHWLKDPPLRDSRGPSPVIIRTLSQLSCVA